jgi:hypothetical protein
MTTVFILEWKNVNWDQYAALVHRLNWGRMIESGSLCLNEGKVIALQTWASVEAFELYTQTYLRRACIQADLPAPAVQSWGIPFPQAAAA